MCMYMFDQHIHAYMNMGGYICFCLHAWVVETATGKATKLRPGSNPINLTPFVQDVLLSLAHLLLPGPLQINHKHQNRSIHASMYVFNLLSMPVAISCSHLLDSKVFLQSITL